MGAGKSLARPWKETSYSDQDFQIRTFHRVLSGANQNTWVLVSS